MDTCHITIYIYLMIATSVSPSEGDSLEIFPAQIFGPSAAKVGENLELKCLISNIQSSNTDIHMYLCKNGVGERLELLRNKTEHAFTLRNISLLDSGTYSCVYSFTRYLTKNVKGSGMNSINVRVTGDALEIFPAQIVGPSTAKVGENVALTCNISNIQSSNTDIHMYLCKNGVGERLELLVNKDEHTFTLRNISLLDSGTYSCLYSFIRYLPKNVTGSGINSINVQVTGDAVEIFPAQIVGPSTAKVGENVALTCSISNIERSNTDIHMYLCKNGVGERLELLRNKDEHTFTLRNISLLDSGTYSCVYSFIRYLQKNVTGSGMNSIHVEVTATEDEKLTVTIFSVKNAVVYLATLLLVGVVFIEMYRYRRIIHDKLCQNQGQSSEPANRNNSQGQVNQTVIRTEIYSDMGEYATIPEVAENIRPLAARDSASMAVYSLAAPSEIYCLAQNHENEPALQRETGQSEAAAVYTQVVKKKRK